MMNIYETLKKLTFIKPDKDYSKRSRSVILSMLQDMPRPRVTLWQFVMQNVQLGSAIALTGLLLLLGFGGFSAWKAFSPFGINSLDPANLRAEADAVKDIEVALNSVQYVQPTDSATPKLSLKNVKPKATAPTTLSAPTQTATLRATPTETTSTQSESEISSTSASTSINEDFSTTTVDSALDLLIEQ
jgi:hypothetical protein